MSITRSSLLHLMFLMVVVNAETKIRTITIHSPTSGATLNPLGAAINTKLQAKYYSSPYTTGLYSPYSGIGLGAGLAGYGDAVGTLAGEGYGTALGGYGGVPNYQYGYPGLPGSYNVRIIYPANNFEVAYRGGYHNIGGYIGGYPNVRGYPNLGGYPNVGGYPKLGGYPNVGGYPNIGEYSNTGGLLPGNPGIYGSQLGVNQIGLGQGFLSYDSVNKLSGYGS